MAKKFSFPSWLDASPEKIKEEEARQDAMRNLPDTRARLTPEELMLSRGRAREITARQNLLVAEADKKRLIKAKEDRTEVENQIEIEKARLAESLAMQGFFHEASGMHPDKETRKHYREIIKAINRGDDEACKCRDERIKVNEIELDVPADSIEREVFSIPHGQVVAIHKCQHCGFRNAKPLTGRHLELRGIRREQRVRAGGQRLRTDAEVLRVKC